jgi:hypothetical protein
MKFAVELNRRTLLQKSVAVVLRNESSSEKVVAVTAGA